jgi:predicted acyl esterase
MRRHRNFKLGTALAAACIVMSVLVTPAGADPGSPDSHGCRPEPYPCGRHWPVELEGRDDFELDHVEEVEVIADDGTSLHGWVAFPTVPDGVKMPTVLSSSPYYDSAAGGTIYRNPTSQVEASATGNPGWWSDTEPPSLDVATHSAGFPPVRLLRKGYAMAYFSVRGTGDSGGCFDGGGALDQSDQGDIIDWIAAQDWSNERVGMVGLSAPTRPSWQAAVEAPEALKTIVTAGDFLDIYQWVHTPQGSKSLAISGYYGDWSAQVALFGGLFAGHTGIAGRAECDPGRFGRQEAASLVTGDRNADYYSERSVATELGRIKAAVLDTSGYLDLLGHYGQDSTIWGSLDPKTPQVAIRGYWGHAHPTPYNPWGTQLNFPSGTVEWEQYVTSWFDFWLKGIGPEPRTDVVYHQDQNLVWHEATNWSPAPNKKEVLYLSQEGLSTSASSGDVTFRSAPSPLDAHYIEQAAKSLSSNGFGGPANEGFNPILCPTRLDEGLSHAYLSSAATSPVLIAGNPLSYVNVSSDEPGGTVTVSLYDIEPGSSCTGSHVTGARYIASGSADLNFYETPYLSHEFPVDTPTRIRIDLSDTTYMLGEGHRLAVLVSNGGPYERGGSLFTPNITIHGAMGGPGSRASHIVVPVADGTLGGKHPTVNYPSRPFTPDGYKD